MSGSQVKRKKKNLKKPPPKTKNPTKICEQHVFQNLENLAYETVSLKDEIIHKIEKFYGIFFNSKTQLFPLESTDRTSKFKGIY